MRRFDQDGLLDRVCARGELQAVHLSGLADTLVAFHATAQRASQGSRYGAPVEVIAPMRDNLRDLGTLLLDNGVSARLLALLAWTESEFEKLTPLLQARQQSGCVRECHGDLHLANLVLIDNRVQIFDCIEFSDDLRWIDVASEIAFVYVDLIAHVQPGHANWFVNEVWERTGDYQAARVLRFYSVYRALVRAKLAAIGIQQTRHGHTEVMTYIALAERLVSPRPLRLVITHGLSGSGKTTASSALLQIDLYACTVRLRSDTERKRLFGTRGCASSGEVAVSDIYASSAGVATYLHLLHQCEMLLCAGWSVIVDAAFLKRADRESFRALAARIGAQFSILAPEATPEQLRERILARQLQGKDASDANLDVLVHQVKVIEPLVPEELCMRLALATQ
jgi:predicted kinase